MKICVFGLWHLGSVTAACLAEHFDTVGIDPNPDVVVNLNDGTTPLYEPGLQELVRSTRTAGRLRFTTDLTAASESDLAWVTFDTPVDDEDNADFEFVEHQLSRLFPNLRDGAVVLISSQVPAGFTEKSAARFRSQYPDKNVGFAYSPENLRLGHALDAFRHPDRIVVGAGRDHDRALLGAVLSHFCKTLIWMSPTSAEMTKHALNAFLATSIAFINEIALLCEAVGADAREVERGLKSEARIGQRAYLRAGAAFAGGTLARDIGFLGAIGEQTNIGVPLIKSVAESNNAHKSWVERRLTREFGSAAGVTVAILGLTYKPGTDTLRRSASVELCRWLLSQGAIVRVFDPKVSQLPSDLDGRLLLGTSLPEVVRGSDAVVVGTPWPAFRASAEQIAEALGDGLLVDPQAFLENELGARPSVRYATVGKPGVIR